MHAALARGTKALVAATALLAFSALAAEPPPASAGAAPASADVRPKSYNVGGALAIGTDSGYVFQSSGGPVRLDVGSITNESTTVTSGSIRVALIVTTTPDPNAGTYWIIAHTDLGPLAPGQRVGPFSTTVDYFTPPNGTYYLHMAVFEYEPTTCTAPSGYCLDDYVTFQNRVQVVNGQIYDAGPAPGAQALAVEYYHVAFNHYFITAFPNEIDLLDRGVFSGWQRTGRSFSVWLEDTGGMSGVCRFFSTAFAPRSSHFYTPYADECTTVRGNRNWQFEAIAFYTELPDTNGTCAFGRQPLYRLYNNGQSGAPNHRYTTSFEVRQEMVAQGWIPEGWGPWGAIACVPQS